MNLTRDIHNRTKTAWTAFEWYKNVIDFNGEYETAKEKFGELAYYSYDRVEGDYTVKAKVELNSAKLYTDTGYMWIEYTKDLYTEDGTFGWQPNP